MAVTLDVFQMQQCDNQGRLFESLDSRDIDAKVFIKAFMNSRAAAGLDSSFDHFQWAGNEYIYEDVVEEYGLKPMQRRNPSFAVLRLPFRVKRDGHRRHKGLRQVAP